MFLSRFSQSLNALPNNNARFTVLMKNKYLPALTVTNRIFIIVVFYLHNATRLRIAECRLTKNFHVYITTSNVKLLV